MKRIRKSLPEPKELSDYRARFTRAPRPPTWDEFKSDPRRREPLKDRLRLDQRGLCAYCENRLLPQNESVEHWVPRAADPSRELDWSNLLLCCVGGEKSPPEGSPEVVTGCGTRDYRTCGHAKLGDLRPILNPLGLPAFPCLFRFTLKDGAIFPDADCCQSAGIDADLADQTITVLNLNAGRLNRARSAVLEEMLRQLESDGCTPAFSPERARQIAAEQFPPTGNLPPFFTTIRWILGPGAENYLEASGYQG